MSILYRRLGGIALALIMIPVFMGLLACMPVPVGNPERSRLDEDLSGAWVGISGGSVELFLYDPYDKRSWLVLTYSDFPDIEGPPLDITYEQALAAVVDSDPELDTDFGIFKAWRTKLAGHWFVVWEAMGGDLGYADPTLERIYYIWRIEKLEPGRIRMYMVNDGYDGFDDIDFDILDEGRSEKTVNRLSRQVEKVIKRNIDDPDLYGDHDDEDATIFIRLKAKDWEDM